jgi:hypothetical protein
MAILRSGDVAAFLSVSGVTLTTAQNTFLTLVQPMIEGAVQRFLNYEVAQATYTEFHPERPPQPYLDGDDLVVGWEMVGATAMPRLRGDRSGAVLQLRRIPVRDILVVNENPAAWGTGVEDGDFPAADIVDPTSYYVDESEAGLSWTGQVYRFGGVWSQAHRSVQVQYTAGFTAGELAGTSGNSELMLWGPQIRLAVLIAIQDLFLKMLTRSKMIQLGGVMGSFSIPGIGGSFASMRTEGYSLPPESKQLLEQFVNYSRIYGR